MSDPGRETEEFRKARSSRNVAIALGLVAFVVLIFVVTINKLGANVLNRPF